MTQVYATSAELRSIADLIDNLNDTVRAMEQRQSVVGFDNISVTDENGGVLGVLEWRTEADSYGVALR